MANLSNINNKLIVTDGGNLLVNATANLATYGGITIDNFSDPSIAMKTTGTSGWLWTQYITSTGTNNFSMGVNQTAPSYWCVKAGAGMDSPHLVVNSSGNVGIGVTSPNAKLSLAGGSNINSQNSILYIDTNSYYATAADRYITTSTAARYIQLNGSHIWSSAPSGTAGNAISFTEKMRIDSSGKMTIPAIANGIKFEITSSAGSGQSIIEMGQVGSDGFLDVSAAGGGIVSHLSGYTGYASYFLSPVGIGTTDGTGGFNVNSTTAGSYYNMSNVDSGNYKYTNPGGRLLTSNATGWFADGRDPILTLSSSGNSENSAIGNSIGLNLYTNSYTYNNFSPLITFSALSDSGSYASAYAAIAGRKTNRGPDTNWNTGDLCFWTTGPEASNPASYMQQAPTMVIKSGGNVGINENSPDAKLHVMGTTGLPATSGTAFTGTMRLGVSGGYGTVMDFGAVGPSTGTQWIQVTDASNQAIQYPLLLQPNGGDVGIGTASPNRKLHVAGKAIVGQTANYSSNAGMMHVYGDNSENSGILDIASNGNGRYYTRVCWNKTSTSQAGYWHIKTNVPIGGNVMFMAKFYGYIYGSAQVLDLTHTGYAYSGTNTVINQGVQNNGNNVNSSSAYYTSAGGSKLCFRVAFGTGATFSTYFAGVFMDMAFPSPAGAAFDFEIEAQSFSQNTTVY